MTKQKVVAPFGKFRVIYVDLNDGDDWQEGDFDSFQLAKDCADEKVKEKSVLAAYVYDDKGNCLHVTNKI